MPRSKPENAPVRVLIVDDSRAMRLWVRQVLSRDARLSIVAEAEDAHVARKMMRKYRPDVITLDVHMPGLSGIEFLRRVMAIDPVPVVMLSALTEQGSSAAIEALSLGAVDCLPKPRSALTDAQMDDLCARVHAAASSTVARRAPLPTLGPSRPEKPRSAPDWPASNGAIFLGASTGGVAALEQVLERIDGLSIPVLIAQHMPQQFLESFSSRLNRVFERRFELSHPGLTVQRGHGIIMSAQARASGVAVAGDKMTIVPVAATTARQMRLRPSIDALFESAADIPGPRAAALLTGMGRDGAAGLLAMRKSGGETFAQDETSSVVFGMPRAAIACGAAGVVAPPDQIGLNLSRFVRTAAARVGVP